MTETIRGLLGRRLRVAVLGGGVGAQIGATHRLAMRFDDAFAIVAGVVSSDPGRALADGVALGLPRAYPDLAALIAGEAGRDDRPDIVAIMTPNDAHAEGCVAALEAGYHVICDKPLANTREEVDRIAALARRRDRLLCITHNYAGYPMVRQMRAMVREGTVGPLHQVHVRYAQGTIGPAVNDPETLPKALRWRLDPARGGDSNLLLDVGTHAHHLLYFVTGMDFTGLCADLGASFGEGGADDTAAIFGRLTNGARASLHVTKAATGAPQILDMEVYGSDGGLRWRQEDPQRLVHWSPGAPARHYDRAVASLDPAAKDAIRSPSTHPEGFREAFANIYANFGSSVAEHLTSGISSEEKRLWPGPDYAQRSLRFVEACVGSSASRGWVSL